MLHVDHSRSPSNQCTEQPRPLLPPPDGEHIFTIAAKFPELDLVLEIFPPITDPSSMPKGPPSDKPIIPPIKLPQIDINYSKFFNLYSHLPILS